MSDKYIDSRTVLVDIDTLYNLGWDEETELVQLQGFINQLPNGPEQLFEYLAEIAKEEKEYCNEE